MSRGWEGGSTRAWRVTREFVLRRDGYACRIRMDGCIGRATHVHHTLGKRMGDDPSLLVASCAPCNLRTGDPARHDPAPNPMTEW